MYFIFKGPGLVPVGSHGELGYWTNDTPQKKKKACTCRLVYF